MTLVMATSSLPRSPAAPIRQTQACPRRGGPRRAQKANAFGLKPKPWVKTIARAGQRRLSLIISMKRRVDQGSRRRSALTSLVMAALPASAIPALWRSRSARLVNNNDIVAASVISGNRNFEGRVSPDVRANFLASPPLVVAYALKGTVTEDFHHDADRTGDRRERMCTSRTSGRPTRKWPTRWPQTSIGLNVPKRAMQTSIWAMRIGRRSRSKARKPINGAPVQHLCRQPSLFRRHDHDSGAGD